MLFPDIVQFPLSEVAILQEIMEDLSFLGFELTDLGGGSYAINGVPAGIEGLNPIDLIPKYGAYSYGKRWQGKRRGAEYSGIDFG